MEKFSFHSKIKSLFLGVVQVQQMDNTPTIYHPVRGVKKNYEDSEDKINRLQRHKTSPELRYQFFAFVFNF